MLNIKSLKSSLPRRKGAASSAGGPSLTVLCAVHRQGGLTAASLRLLRDVADEIIVAYDSRIDPGELGPLESVCDRLIGFEFAGANRFRPWLREQATGDWILLLDSDELVSEALLKKLPKLIRDRQVGAYLVPNRSVLPGTDSVIVGQHWDISHPRLVRNDQNLWFTGQKHTGASYIGPAVQISQPIIHLHLLIDSVEIRRQKVVRYDGEAYGLMTDSGLPLNHAHYLPEDQQVELVGLAPEDIRNVRQVMASQDSTGTPGQLEPIATADELEKWIPGKPMSQDDYRAKIIFRADVPAMVAGSSYPVQVRVKNNGNAVWPPGHLGGVFDRQINISYHWLRPSGEVVEFDGHRTHITERLIPKQAVDLTMAVKAPSEAGEYLLSVDLVHEEQRWFRVAVNTPVTISAPPSEIFAELGSPPFPLPEVLRERRRINQQDGLSTALAEVGTNEVDGIAFGGWALDVQTMNFIHSFIAERGLQRVLEFGSGSSTASLAAYLAPRGGRVVSIDESETYAGKTRDLIHETCDDGSGALVLSTDLVPVESFGVTTKCYRLSPEVVSAIEDLDPQLILVDGPSRAEGGSRLAVLSQLIDHLNGNPVFLLDDAYRDVELSIASVWDQHPRIEVEGILPLGKGLLLGKLLCD